VHELQALAQSPLAQRQPEDDTQTWDYFAGSALQPLPLQRVPPNETQTFSNLDTESLVLNLTALGLIAQLQGEHDGVNTADEWGWTCLHKAAVYGKKDHVVALLDAGVDVSRRTAHDPAQMYEANVDALRLAELVQEQGWGERRQLIEMLKLAAAGQWQVSPCL
jgi:hypothetical protein